MSKELKNAYQTLMFFLTEGVKQGIISSNENDVNGETVNSYQWFAASIRRHARLSEEEQMNHIRKLLTYMNNNGLIVEKVEVKR